MKIIKANTVLPKGGELIVPPQRKKIATWVEMEFDAQVYRFGIRWLRIKGGFNGRGDREDWVADIAVSASVHDYQFRPPYWGFEKYKSFDDAVRAQIKKAIEETKTRILEWNAELSKLKKFVQFAESLGS